MMVSNQLILITSLGLGFLDIIKKSQNIVLREITFAQSLYEKKIIFFNDLCYFGIRQLFRNLATILDIGFGNSDFRKSENNFGDHP